MELVNLLDVPSRYGLRQFRLVQGDISKLDFPVDLLCVSAFKGGYLPTPNTLLGALCQNRGIHLDTLARTPLFDFRATHGTFVVGVEKDPHIKKILCLEMVGTRFTLEELLENLLVTLYTLELKGVVVKSLMLPLVGTGSQQLPLSELIGALLKKAEYLLSTSPSIEEIFLVSYREQDTAALTKAMNTFLRRTSSMVPRSEIINSVGREIAHRLQQAHLSEPPFGQLQALLQQADIEAFELAITARKICEHILNALVPEGKSFDLARKIQRLRTMSVAPWIPGYFHLLRIFGNEYAHDQAHRVRTPQAMSSHDLSIALFGLERILEFYAYYRQTAGETVAAGTHVGGLSAAAFP